MLNGQELFGAAIRVIGFCVLLHGLYTVIWGFLYSFWPHYWENADGEKRAGVAAGHFFFTGGLQAFIGMMVLAEAQRITVWVY